MPQQRNPFGPRYRAQKSICNCEGCNRGRWMDRIRVAIALMITVPILGLIYWLITKDF